MGNKSSRKASPSLSKKQKGTSSSSLSPSTEPFWEWQDDSDWKRYDNETQAIIEEAYSNGTANLVLDHGYFGNQGGYSIDLSRFEQVKISTGNIRNIRRTPVATPIAGNTSSSPAQPEVMLEDNALTTDNSPKWFFKNAEGEWELYDKQTTRLIEGSYSNGMMSVSLNHGKFENHKGGFFVDFTELVQIEQATKESVEIKRDPAATKRTKKNDKEKEKRPSDEQGFEKVEESKAEGAKKLTKWKEISEGDVPKEETCPICFCELLDGDGDAVVQLSKCTGHFFHRGCITHCYSAGYIQCPICNVLYGVRVGNMPSGTMNVTKYAKGQNPLPSYEDCGTIQIDYSFPDGTQTHEHPHPGVSYTGTSRSAYLPDNKEGQEVLRLLQLGWERRLLFTVGLSRTTGSDDQVIWNGVHHKTNTSGGPTNFGYPDETYFERVKAELAAKGVS